MAWTIYVVGPCRVNNELLASFLEAKVEAKCVTKGTIDDVLDLRGQEADNPKLVLLDCFAKDPERLFLEVESCHRDICQPALVAVFNLIRGLKIEEEMVMRGIRGIFYANDNPGHLVRGVRALLEGETWVSREIMSKFIPEIEEARRVSATKTSVLSQREAEILGLVAEGAMNTEIAQTLYISRHTVKSHLYNIYKKIKVTNRLEAALWANNNLNNQA
ncbi:MAG: response regulator transcription factor [Deltaproteobacteria bacterium]|nr:MAG: response regulator transcription factor [Deltaproteobacteria bacterium]